MNKEIYEHVELRKKEANLVKANEARVPAGEQAEPVGGVTDRGERCSLQKHSKEIQDILIPKCNTKLHKTMHRSELGTLMAVLASRTCPLALPVAKSFLPSIIP